VTDFPLRNRWTDLSPSEDTGLHFYMVLRTEDPFANRQDYRSTAKPGFALIGNFSSRIS
jgi:hypothetical protein